MHTNLGRKQNLRQIDDNIVSFLFKILYCHYLQLNEVEHLFQTSRIIIIIITINEQFCVTLC